MRVLNPDYDLQRFLESVSTASHPVLLLDYDGTLAPFCEKRDRATPYPGLRELLSAVINQNRTRVVIISGRSIDDLLPLLAMNPPPELWGSHGLERLLPDGTRTSQELPENTKSGLHEIIRWAAREKLDRVVELKPSGAAFHWRGLSDTDAQSLKLRIEERWATPAAQFGMELHEFDGGLEIRIAGITKAVAVRVIITETDANQPVAFLGDDFTDEDAFRALSGRGLSVLVRPECRETAADIWITPPDELVQFLGHWR